MLLKKITLFPLDIRHKASSSKRGFSLVELIVIAAIIAIMAAISMVSFSSLSKDRLAADAQKIVSDLCWARQLAVSGHQNYLNTGRQNYTVDFDITNEKYTVYWGTVAQNNQVKTQTLSPGVDLVSVTPSTQVTFSFPFPKTIDTTIRLTSQGKSTNVLVIKDTGYAWID